ncbi:MAG: ABC transporter permease [Candidatus Saccharimonadaceae bacterium]
MSKLKAVIRHEYVTIVKQPSFWIFMFMLPALLVVIMAINIFSSQSSSDHIEKVTKELQSVVVVDESGLIDKSIVSASGLTLHKPSEQSALKDKVIAGDIRALIVFPIDLKTTAKYQIFMNGMDFTTLSAVQATGSTILKTSLFLPLGSAEIIALAQNGAEGTMTFYANGKETNGFNDYIAPGIFAVLFFTILSFSLSYMLTSVSEEKENRSMEMVLTYVKPRTLIVGKILGVSLVTLTQLAFFLALAAVAYLVTKNTGSLSALPLGIDLAKITFDPFRIFFAVGFMAVGFLLYAGLMVTVAAMAPSAKEANSFSGVFILGAIIPIYFVALIITDPSSPVTNFLTFFPLSSPMTNLLRNTVGSLEPAMAWGSLGVMTLFMISTIWIAIRAFGIGALEFAQSVKLSTLFGSKHS